MSPFSLYEATLQGNFSAETTAWIAHSMEKEPFFALPHMMHAKQQGDAESLFTAATYAPDRTLLKRYMEGKTMNASAITASDEAVITPQHTAKQSRNRAFSIVNFDALYQPLRRSNVLNIQPIAAPNLQLDAFLNVEIKIATVQALKQLPIIRTQLRKDLRVNPVAPAAKPQPAESRKIGAAKRITRPDADQLLDSFLERMPSISRQTMATPPAPIAPNAYQSVEEDQNLATETLAMIYSKQGNFIAAIEIYRKLCLVFPNKRAYFEAKISQLSEK